MTFDTLASRRLSVRHSLARAPQQLFGFVVYAIYTATLRAQGEDRVAAKSSKIANDLRNLPLLIWSDRQGISHAVLDSNTLLGVCMLGVRDSVSPNPAAGKARSIRLFAVEHHYSGLPDPGR
jgi:hypothetical protein